MKNTQFCKLFKINMKQNIEIFFKKLYINLSINSFWRLIVSVLLFTLANMYGSFHNIIECEDDSSHPKHQNDNPSKDESLDKSTSPKPSFFESHKYLLMTLAAVVVIPLACYLLYKWFISSGSGSDSGYPSSSDSGSDSGSDSNPNVTHLANKFVQLFGYFQTEIKPGIRDNRDLALQAINTVIRLEEFEPQVVYNKDVWFKILGKVSSGEQREYFYALHTAFKMRETTLGQQHVFGSPINAQLDADFWSSFMHGRQEIDVRYPFKS